MNRLKKLFLDLTQLGHVQPLTKDKIMKEIQNSSRKSPSEWWYLGTDNHYHYLAERWGEHHRLSWKIGVNEIEFHGIDRFAPRAGPDRQVGILLALENL